MHAPVDLAKAALQQDKTQMQYSCSSRGCSSSTSIANAPISQTLQRDSATAALLNQAHQHHMVNHMDAWL
jgi:hypothetical protein